MTRRSSSSKKRKFSRAVRKRKISKRKVSKRKSSPKMSSEKFLERIPQKGLKKITMKLSSADKIVDEVRSRLDCLKMFEYSAGSSGSRDMDEAHLVLVCDPKEESLVIKIDVSEFAYDGVLENGELEQMIQDKVFPLLKNCPKLEKVFLHGDFEDDYENMAIKYESLHGLKGVELVTMSRGSSIDLKRFPKDFLKNNKVYVFDYDELVWHLV